jgi:hypothetical protein
VEGAVAYEEKVAKEVFNEEGFNVSMFSVGLLSKIFEWF